MELNSLTFDQCIALLDDPIALKETIETYRLQPNLSVEVLGFIAYYDQLNGDCQAIQTQLNISKQHILKPLQPVTSHSFSKQLLRIAAIVLPLIASGIWMIYWMKSDQPVLSSLYNDPGIPTFMGNEPSHQLENIMFHYRKGNFTNAQFLLKRALIQQPANDTLLYYSAVTHFAAHQNSEAKKRFHSLSVRINPFQSKATYFLGVIYAEQQQYTHAKIQFQKVGSVPDETISFYANKHLKELAKVH
jgi:TolA-binding protein